MDNNVALCIRGGTIITPEETLSPGWLMVERGKIVSLGEGTPPATLPEAEVIDASGKYVTPGFVDIHMHGALGYDTMDCSLESLDKISLYHTANGTTSWLPTTISTPLEELFSCFDCLREAREKGTSGAEILGAHIEGPYYIPEQRGCHSLEFLRTPDPKEYQQILERGQGIIRMMSLSPELPGSLRLIRTLREHGIVASAGHSNATYKQMEEAIAAGVTHCVHMYNAMGGIYLRRSGEPGAEVQPGLVGTVLTRDELTAEIISDGVHVHPRLIKLLVQAKGSGKIILVTDTMQAAGLGDGEYEFGHQRIIVKEGVARTGDGVLACSTQPMKVMVRKMFEFSEVNLGEVIAMASLNPARVIGVEERKGSLAVGKDADLLILDQNLEVNRTFVKGRLVYERAGN